MRCLDISGTTRVGTTLVSFLKVNGMFTYPRQLYTEPSAVETLMAVGLILRLYRSTTSKELRILIPAPESSRASSSDSKTLTLIWGHFVL